MRAWAKKESQEIETSNETIIFLPRPHLKKSVYFLGTFGDLFGDLLGPVKRFILEKTKNKILGSIRLLFWSNRETPNRSRSILVRLRSKKVSARKFVCRSISSNSLCHFFSFSSAFINKL